MVTVGANPRRGPLARRIKTPAPRPTTPQVGRYAVDVASLEGAGVPALSGDTLNPKTRTKKIRRAHEISAISV